MLVLRRFPRASARPTGSVVRLDGVPGLVSEGVNEEAAWVNAAGELADPVLNAAREERVNAAVVGAFRALPGDVKHPMALIKQLEADGYSSMQAMAAINAAVAADVLVLIDGASVRLSNP